MDNLESMSLSPPLLFFALFNEKTTRIFLVYIYCVDAEVSLMSFVCSSPQWKWRGDPWQQTVYWVFWSGWWSWRGVLVVWKWWNEGKNKWVEKPEVTGFFHTLSHVASFFRNASAVMNAELTNHVLPLSLVAFAAMQTGNQAVRKIFLDIAISVFMCAL